MALLNLLVPMFSWALFYKDNSTGLQECLGKGYNNFLSTKINYCPYDNSILNIFCWTWLCLIVICMSNIVDAYCLFCCGKHINKSTEETKRMLSKESYINRKRYWWLKYLYHYKLRLVFFFTHFSLRLRLRLQTIYVLKTEILNFFKLKIRVL